MKATFKYRGVSYPMVESLLTTLLGGGFVYFGVGQFEAGNRLWAYLLFCLAL